MAMNFRLLQQIVATILGMELPCLTLETQQDLFM